VSDYYVAHLPSDHVPYWDFSVTGQQGEPRDTSAAAVAASGLLELSELDPEPARSATYREAAVDTLMSLSSPPYLAHGTESASILLHGTQNKPDGNFDTGMVVGDYYFLEALRRYAAGIAAD
jgi:unsaturated chondroitin disaccharide hydrolase